MAFAFRPYVEKSAPLLIDDSSVVADGKNFPEKKAEMNLGSAGLTACATL